MTDMPRFQPPDELPEPPDDTPTLWDSDEIQFARLITEMDALGVLTDDLVKELSDTMDLSVERVDELIARALRVFHKVRTEL